MAGKIERFVQEMLAHERAAIDAALERIVLAIGALNTRRRCERIEYDGARDLAAPPFAGRTHTIEVDGREVWRGEWRAIEGRAVAWVDEWKVAPETLPIELAPSVH